MLNDLIHFIECNVITLNSRRVVGGWVDSVNMELGEIGCSGMDWIDYAQDRDQWRSLVTTVMNLQVP
jgi:hypothetical protein